MVAEWVHRTVTAMPTLSIVGEVSNRLRRYPSSVKLSFIGLVQLKIRGGLQNGDTTHSRWGRRQQLLASLIMTANASHREVEFL